jgi:hypothetical protein
MQEANAIMSVMAGLGTVGGNFLGSLPLSTYLPVFDDDVQALYVLASGILVATMSVTVLATDEIPQKSLLSLPRRPLGYKSVEDGQCERVDPAASQEPPEHGSEEDTELDDVGFVEIVQRAPASFHKLFWCQMYFYFPLFSLYIFGTSWVGSEVFMGSADATIGSAARSRYNAGVRAGNRGFALSAVLSMAMSLFLPWIVRGIGARTVLAAALATLGALLVPTIYVGGTGSASSAVVAQGLLAAVGAPGSVATTVTWGLVSASVMRADPARAGTYLTIFNLALCIPDLAVALIAPLILGWTGREASVLGLGGAVAFCGAGYVIWRQVGDDEVDGRANNYNEVGGADEESLRRL